MQEWIVGAVRSLGVFGVGLLMLLENVFPPVPSEYLSAEREMSFWGALLAGSVGSLLGAFGWYVVRVVQLKRSW